MAAITRSFKEQCIALRKSGRSLGEIIAITGRPKSSIYFHICKVSPGVDAKKRWRDAATRRIVSFNHGRKGRSALGRSPKVFNTWTPHLVQLVGHLLFDGEITLHACVYHNRSSVLIKRVQKLMKFVYDHDPKHGINQLTGVLRVSYFNVELASFMRQKSDELLKGITLLSPECKIAFLKAFFDDEGCMDFRAKSNSRKVRGYQKNVRVLLIVKTLLKSFGIEARIVPPNEVVISRKTNLVTFRSKIGFSPGVKINGDRSNSLWKKHLEKRMLLDMAIASFK